MQMTAVLLPLILLNQEITLNYGSWQSCILYYDFPANAAQSAKAQFTTIRVKLP